nr:hypothetical protein CFP56_34967 [Quercus suber]
MATLRDQTYELVEHPDIERVDPSVDVERGHASNRESTYKETLDADTEPALRIQPSTSSADSSTAYFTGLRGLAALCVFNNHTMGSGNHERGFGQEGVYYYFIGLPFVRVFYLGGTAAVSVFFVLSGFVITQSMIKLLRDDRQQDFLRNWVSAMIRRPVRLYLPCWGFALIVAFVLHLPYNFHPSQPWLEPEATIPKELARWAWQCWDYFWPFRHHASDQWWFIYDIVVWTIPIELKGSVLCYGLALLYSRATKSFGLSSPIHLWSVGCLMVVTTVLLEIGYWWQACFTAGFMFTILNAYALDKPLLSRSFTIPTRHRRLIVPASTIGIYLIFFISWYLLSSPCTAGQPEWLETTPGWKWLGRMIPKVYSKAQFYRFWQSWGAIGLVYSTLHLPWLQWLLNTRPFQYLGKVSFMLYLVHLPIAYCFSDRWSRAWGMTPFMTEEKWWDNILYVPEWGLFGFNTQWACIWITTLAVNLAVAHVLTKYLDEPAVRLGKYITRLLPLQTLPSGKLAMLVSLLLFRSMVASLGNDAIHDRREVRRNKAHSASVGVPSGSGTFFRVAIFSTLLDFSKLMGQLVCAASVDLVGPLVDRNPFSWMVNDSSQSSVPIGNGAYFFQVFRLYFQSFVDLVHSGYHHTHISPLDTRNVRCQRTDLLGLRTTLDSGYGCSALETAKELFLEVFRCQIDDAFQIHRPLGSCGIPGKSSISLKVDMNRVGPILPALCNSRNTFRTFQQLNVDSTREPLGGRLCVIEHKRKRCPNTLLVLRRRNGVMEVLAGLRIYGFRLVTYQENLTVQTRVRSIHAVCSDPIACNVRSLTSMIVIKLQTANQPTQGEPLDRWGPLTPRISKGSLEARLWNVLQSQHSAGL